MGRPKPKLEEEKTEGDLSGCDGVGPVLTHANAPPNTPEEPEEQRSGCLTRAWGWTGSRCW